MLRSDEKDILHSNPSAFLS